MDDSPWMPPTPGGPPPPDVPARTAEPPPALAPLLPPPPVSPWARQGLEPPTGPALAEGPLVETVDAAQMPRRRRSKAVLAGAVVAVLAVGAAGVFAVSRFTGAAEGGAGSPTELGTALFTAIENEDVLGTIDLLLPGERELFQQPMIDLVTELSRLDVLTPEADLADIDGIDITLAGTSVTAHETNVPDVVNVDLRADVSATVDGNAFPIGDLVTDNMDPDDVAEIRGTVETTTDELDETLTAVEQDGRWYFSVFYTAAEKMRASTDHDIPNEGIGADGAESPEAAFGLMLDRVESLDLAGMIRALNPGEAAALQRYAPLFLDDAEAEIAAAPLELAITDRQFHVEGEGEQRTVVVDGLTVTASGVDEFTGDSHSAEIRVDGTCTHATVDGEQFDFCAGDTSSIPEVEEFLADAPAIEAFVDSLVQALSDIEPIGVEMREFDGAWFVSPTATYTEAILAVLRALDRQELDELIALAEPAANEVFGQVFGGYAEYEEYPDDLTSGAFDEYSADDSLSLDDPYYDDPYDEVSDESAEASGWERCYSELNAADATACFQEYVTTGELDPTLMPIALRFPECGYAEVSWGSHLYSMSDADFVAAVEAARPCFLALVAAGTIDEYELPTEIAHLECFEGRNWYNVFDEPEYDERYYACLDAASTA
ncbi:MAG TPA: hypothetical protein VE487_00480 [Ilumatobacter sp.]|nr:hypothetical protein [Ilumatobacter sp.]